MGVSDYTTNCVHIAYYTYRGANASQENLIHMYSACTCIQLVTYRYVESKC